MYFDLEEFGGGKEQGKGRDDEDLYLDTYTDWDDATGMNERGEWRD